MVLSALFLCGRSIRSISVMDKRIRLIWEQDKDRELHREGLIRGQGITDQLIYQKSTFV